MYIWIGWMLFNTNLNQRTVNYFCHVYCVLCIRVNLVGFLFFFPQSIQFYIFRQHLRHCKYWTLNNILALAINIHIHPCKIYNGAHSMLLPNWCLSKGHYRIKWPSQQFLQSLYAYIYTVIHTRRAVGNVRTLAMVMVDFIILNFVFLYPTRNLIQHPTLIGHIFE